MADVLIKAGALEKMKAEDRSRLLYDGYEQDCPAMVKQLLDEGISPLLSPTPGGNSPLESARNRVAHPDEHRPLKNLQACIDLMEISIVPASPPPAVLPPALPTPFERRTSEVKISVDFVNKSARDAIQEIQARRIGPISSLA